MATALITGASQGIGACIAKRLAKDGYNVAINHFPSDSDKANAEKVAEECRSFGVEAELFAANVADYAQCEAMTKAVKERFGSIDALVNNAGITKDGFLVRMKDDDFDRVITINLRGAFICTREAAKIMTKARHGRIVNISSVVGQMGNAGQANYSAAKAGLLGLTKSCAKELAARQITVNAVAPGFIETDMTAALSDDVRASYEAAIPLKRMGTAQEIADAVAFLASDKAAYITGQVLAVNGGMYC